VHGRAITHVVQTVEKCDEVETLLRVVLEQAGFATFRRATETPRNIVYEARP
jgi:hypothetical protein